MSAIQTSARPPPGHEIPASDRGDTAGRRVPRLAFKRQFWRWNYD